MTTFYIISVKHTRREDRYITLWGPDDCGYRKRLETSGLYQEAGVRAHGYCGLAGRQEVAP